MSGIKQKHTLLWMYLLKNLKKIKWMWILGKVLWVCFLLYETVSLIVSTCICSAFWVCNHR